VNSGPSAREAIRASYDFALNLVGHDKDSGNIWADYIQFLQSGEVMQVNNNRFHVLIVILSIRLRRHGRNRKKWTLSVKHIAAP
jgi:hypothetical protein